MKNLIEFYSKIKDFEHLQNEVKKSKETFELKPFVKEFYKIKAIVSLARPLLSIFSIITGLGCLYYQFFTSFGAVLSVILSVLSLLFIELIKTEIGLLSFKRLYSVGFSSLNLVLLLFLICFFGLSVFLSVQGAKDIYKALDTQKHTFTNHSQTKKDSITKYYDTQIKNEKKELQNFKNSVAYQGKINIYDKTTSNAIDKHTQSISNLQAQKNKEIDRFVKSSDDKLQSINENTNFNVLFWLVLSLIVEFFIMLSLWFLIWFAWRVSLENEILNNESFVFTQEDLQSYFNNRLSTLVNNSGFGSHSPNEKTLLIENKLSELNENVTNLKSQLTTENDNDKGNVGFKFVTNNDTKPLVTTTRNDTRNDNLQQMNNDSANCVNCGASFKKMNKKHIFCKDLCRIESWKKRTGKDIIIK